MSNNYSLAIFQTEKIKNFIKKHKYNINYSVPFINIQKEILQISSKYNFYKKSIIKLFDKRNQDNVLEHYHIIYTKDLFHINSFIIFSISKTRILLEFIFVKPNYRKQGLATLLINQTYNIVGQLYSLGLIKKTIYYELYTNKNNTNMILFMKKEHYKIIKHNDSILKDYILYRKLNYV